MAILLQRNVQLDVLTLRGKSPLHIAVENSMTELVRLLIHHGCDVNVQVFKTLKFVLISLTISYLIKGPIWLHPS